MSILSKLRTCKTMVARFLSIRIRKIVRFRGMKVMEDEVLVLCEKIMDISANHNVTYEEILEKV